MAEALSRPELSTLSTLSLVAELFLLRGALAVVTVSP